jgi:hypothetical protein
MKTKTIKLSLCFLTLFYFAISSCKKDEKIPFEKTPFLSQPATSNLSMSDQDIFENAEIVGIAHNMVLDSVYRFYEKKFNSTSVKDTFTANEYNILSINIARHIMNEQVGFNFDPIYYDDWIGFCQYSTSFIEFNLYDTINFSPELINLVKDLSAELRQMSNTTTNEDWQSFATQYYYENLNQLTNIEERKIFASAVQIGIYSVVYWGENFYNWIDLFSQGQFNQTKIMKGGTTLFALPPSGRDIATTDAESGLMSAIGWGGWGLAVGGPVGAGALGLAGFGVGAGVGSVGAIGKYYFWQYVWPS